METPTESADEGEEKPRKKTRRGTRGGRGRRKKKATEGTLTDEALDLEPAGESPLVTSEQ
jgi:hypothetical protein